MSIISVNIGKGLAFNENKITTDWDESSDVEKRENGLYIPNRIGGSTVDEIGLHALGDRTIEINRDVIQIIHSMCINKVTSRNDVASYTVDSSAIKTIDDIRDECNANSNNGVLWSTYSLRTNDLFMLSSIPHPVKMSGWSCAMDEDKRYPGDYCLALFVITDVEYSRSHYVSKLTIQCLYSSTTSYTKGTSYTSTD